ncbi:hypothetical protein POM88_032281 [Heracleum sosnowskyi]|uniref:DDE Tnp4 domain-containing protein n=1 Tax=Heracleum sosnowskyi TaxID=360622 RepID=A0AAD8HZU8_9APIA|nr:hypothetical protein POM88_032281 [Heracleum sosnowskyi]
MARMPLCRKKQAVATCITIYNEMVERIIEILIKNLHVFVELNATIPRPMNYLFDDSIDDRFRARFLNIKSIIQVSDQVCIDNIRMDRNCFDNLCGMLRDVGGLKGNRNMDMGEMKPESITADFSEHNWRCFKNCLGALDGTHIKKKSFKGSTRVLLSM